MNILSILSQSPADAVEQLAESILPKLGDVSVVFNRTGIAMLPYCDSAKGVTFHLGEVLMADAHVECALPDGRVAEGYGACLGRNTRHALAIALIDAAHRLDIHATEIHAFASAQEVQLQSADAELLDKVERTRIEMETF